MANFRYLYFIWLLYSQNYAAGIHVHYHESSVFLIPQNSLYKSSHSKTNTCQIFLSKTQKNPSIIPVTWNPEYPPPLGMYMWQFWTAKNIFSLNQQEERLNKTDTEVVNSSYDAERFVQWESERCGVTRYQNVI